MSSARTKAHIFQKDVFEANNLEDEDDVIFLKKGAKMVDIESSPQSIMHNIMPNIEEMKLPEAILSPVKEHSASERETPDVLDSERSLISKFRMPIKMSGDEVGVHSRNTRREKNKARALSQKYWTRKRAARASMLDNLEIPGEEEEEAEEQPKGPPARSSNKIREKARRSDRRSARDAKCASWFDNEVETVIFVPKEVEPVEEESEPELKVLYVPVSLIADPIFQELIAQDRIIAVPRIPTKMNGSDEVGLHSRMARREKKNARELSKKHWSRVRAAKRSARADHDMAFAQGDAEDEEEAADYWPAAPQYSDKKSRRGSRQAARDAKCASWGDYDEEVVVFPGRPKVVQVVKDMSPWVSRTELPASIAVIDPAFEELVASEAHVDVGHQHQDRMAKRCKVNSRETTKKFWSRKRAAKATQDKFMAGLPVVDESEEEEAPAPPTRSSKKVREKARRQARDAKIDRWGDEDALEHVVFPNKGWLEGRPASNSVARADVMYEPASSPASPNSVTTTAARMTPHATGKDVSRARLKLSFGDAIRLKPVSTIRKGHETGRRAHRRHIVESARAA